jgi:hypothetical protein
MIVEFRNNFKKAAQKIGQNEKMHVRVYSRFPLGDIQAFRGHAESREELDYRADHYRHPIPKMSCWLL